MQRQRSRERPLLSRWVRPHPAVRPMISQLEAQADMAMVIADRGSPSGVPFVCGVRPLSDGSGTFRGVAVVVA